MSDLSFLTIHVENNISEALPERSAMIFDGQSTPTAHYVGVFASFQSLNLERFL